MKEGVFDAKETELPVLHIFFWQEFLKRLNQLCSFTFEIVE